MKIKSKPPRRVTLVLRVDLADRALKTASELQQNPNNFVNLCVEGVLDAMDSLENYTPPILDLHNRIKGKTFLTSKAVTSIFSMIEPDIKKMDAKELECLVQLINDYEGCLTADILKSLRKLAGRMHQEKLGHQKELESLLTNNRPT